MKTQHPKYPDTTAATYSPKDMKQAYAVRSAQDRIRELKERLEGTLREIGRYEEQLATSTSNVARVQVLGSAVHYMGVNNNPRLDLLAASMVELAQLGD